MSVCVGCVKIPLLILEAEERSVPVCVCVPPFVSDNDEIFNRSSRCSGTRGDERDGKRVRSIVYGGCLESFSLIREATYQCIKSVHEYFRERVSRLVKWRGIIRARQKKHHRNENLQVEKC